MIVAVPTTQIRPASTIPSWWPIALSPLLIGYYGGRAIAVGILLVIPMVAVTAVIGHRRSRKSVLHTEHLPIQIGERFAGHIEAELRQVPPEDFWLLFSCRKYGADDPPNELMLWQDELSVPGTDTSVTDDRLRIPFHFDMPTSGEVTGYGVDWKLRISNGDYEAEFEIPVVRADGPVTVADERVRMFSAVRESLRHRRRVK